MNISRCIVTWLGKTMAGVLIISARFYQLSISPLLGAHCRYSPSCSEYFIQSVRQRGPLVGGLAGLWRVCRCHPFARGGYDPVEPGE
ncbi:MAG: membrane protein insertion efficiency factor YidD [Actinobacteria bacterium]|nr:membrane protein insertion efficiency factor YidD [Actinomycetota bacterium]